jgi:hypothetical protein
MMEQNNELPPDDESQSRVGCGGMSVFVNEFVNRLAVPIGIIDVGQSYEKMCELVEAKYICSDCGTALSEGSTECAYCGAGRKGSKPLRLLKVSAIQEKNYRDNKFTAAEIDNLKK